MKGFKTLLVALVLIAAVVLCYMHGLPLPLIYGRTK